MRVVLGTMTFGGGPTDAAVSKQLVKVFLQHTHQQEGGSSEETEGEALPIAELDTAALYQNGKTEKILGDLLLSKEIKEASAGRKVVVATKVNPFGKNSLAPNKILKQFETSLKSLRCDSVDILYLHAPDPKTPIEETLATVQKLYEEGKFKELGLSNYAAWQVVDIYHLCKSNGWVLPTVYQGMYNPITRAVEAELFPALRRLNIRFYAYNPLAGGLLTGRYSSFEEKPTEGRFKTNPMYGTRYWRETCFQALNPIKAACEQEGITMVEASLRWLCHHSSMNACAGDAIILGASSVAHLEENLRACLPKKKEEGENTQEKNQAGPLPENLVKSFQEAWNLTKGDCPSYFR